VSGRQREHDDGDDDERPQTLRGALHDVSNALTVVLGWVDEARATELTEAERHAALRMIDAHARRARDLARQAIGVEVEPASSRPRAVDQVVDDVLAALGPQAREAGVVLVVDPSGDPSPVLDPVGLHHALVNLVLNAIAHSPQGQGALVRVHVATDGGAFRIDVADEGLGVPAARVPTLFSGASTREGGAGVGLVHTRSVARRAGGDLMLAESEGRGATFRLSWPRGDALSRPSASRVRGGLTLVGLRFVVVEDDPAVVMLLEAALEARGADVCVVSDQPSLAAALSAPHDGAIVDLSPLEGLVLPSLAAVARAGRPGAPLVLATGSADAIPQELAGLSAHVCLVRKPYEIGEVLQALTERGAVPSSA